MYIVCKVLAKAIEISCSTKAIHLPLKLSVAKCRKIALLKHSEGNLVKTQFHFSRMRSLPKFAHEICDHAASAV